LGLLEAGFLAETGFLADAGLAFFFELTPLELAVFLPFISFPSGIMMVCPGLIFFTFPM
jgi:hypothetical protein